MKAHQSQLEGLGCQVVVVARGTRESADIWFKHTQISYPLLLDPDLTMYRYFGLGRSVTAVWTIPTLLTYAKEKVAGVPPAPAYPGDDIHVLGGDFIFDSTGKVVYAYCSKFSSDRPPLYRHYEAMAAASVV